jgi:hypothetical protein
MGGDVDGTGNVLLYNAVLEIACGDNELCEKRTCEPKFQINPLTPELNPSAQRRLTRFFTGDFAS